MRPPKPIIAYHIPDAQRRRFPSKNEMYKRLGISSTYADLRVNTGIPCKGWLLYDENHSDAPETREHLRKHCPEYDGKLQAIEAHHGLGKRSGGYVSVRIDSRTTILVKADKWTPDYAERYREKLRESNTFVQRNSGDWRNKESVKKGARK